MKGISFLSILSVLVAWGTVRADENCRDSAFACPSIAERAPDDENRDLLFCNRSLAYYLNLKFANNPKALEEIGLKLKAGKLVVIRNAFPLDLAETVHHDLDEVQDWDMHEACAPSGFCYRHHNFYDWSRFTSVMNATLNMFDGEESRDFMSGLSGRNCRGDKGTDGPPGSASRYFPLDFSMPHSDHVLYRSVAYVWHLSKDWRPEWGGALYWASDKDDTELHRYRHASFNTLVLFNVNSKSSHMVTIVSNHAQQKRLSFNGWWSSSWRPSIEDDFDSILATKEQRTELSDYEVMDLRNFAHDERNGMQPEKRRRLIELVSLIEKEIWPSSGGTGVFG